MTKIQIQVSTQFDTHNLRYISLETGFSIAYIPEAPLVWSDYRKNLLKRIICRGLVRDFSQRHIS